MKDLEAARAAVDNWTAITADLRSQLDAATAALTDVTERRRALVLPARTGAQDAATQLASIDAERNRLEREVADLSQAIEDSEANLAAAEASVAQLEREQNLNRAAELDAEAVKVAAGVDKALAAIKGSVDRCRELLEEADLLRDDAEKKKAPRVGNVAASSYWAGALSFHGLTGAHDCHPAYRRPFAEALK